MFRIPMMLFLAAAGAGVLSSNAVAGHQWVWGQVQWVEDFGGYQGGLYGVRIRLKDQVWNITQGQAQDGEQNCTSEFRVRVGVQGVTEEIKMRIFSLMLTGYSMGSKVGLFVDTSTGPYCEVQIGRMGEGF